MMEREVSAERQKVRLLLSDNVEVPLLRFVLAEAESVRPALLDMAPEGGTLTINGEPLSAQMAKAGAKALRKLAKAKRDSGGWITETIPASKA